MHRQSLWNSRVKPNAGLVVWLIVLTLSACAAPPSTPTMPSPSPSPTATDLPTSEPTVTPTLLAATVAPTEAPATPVPPTATTAPTETSTTSAQYQLTFEATWSAATHPIDFPPNPHFSGLIGASHSPAVRLWQEGEAATPGIKNMAETGAKSPLDSEIDSLINSGSACAKLSGGGIKPSPGMVTVTLTVSQDCPVVSVVTMIAPSPDWFVGVSGLSLFENGAWTEHMVVDLFPYVTDRAIMGHA